MDRKYYIVRYGQQTGPFPKEELMANGLTPDMLVWTEGMSGWVKASEISGLRDLFCVDVRQEQIPGSEYDINVEGAYGVNVPPYAGVNASGWFAMLGGIQVGPHTVDELCSRGLRQDTPVWRQGMSGWQEARAIPELRDALSHRDYGHYGMSPYGAPQSLGNMPPHGGMPGVPPMHTNWLTWAIVATILGFFGQCIGAIVGVIAIVQAQKAERLYRENNVMEAESANSSAKTLTIVALVLDGLGFIFGAYYLKNIMDYFPGVF